MKYPANHDKHHEPFFGTTLPPCLPFGTPRSAQKWMIQVYFEFHHFQFQKTYKRIQRETFEKRRNREAKYYENHNWEELLLAGGSLFFNLTLI